MTEEHFHRRRRWFGWLRVLAGFGSAQIVIQAIGFLSGILVVRYLTKPDYAWFTIANALVATMAVLADSGVSGALSSIGGRVWQDNVRLGALIRTALTLRRMLALVGIVVITPFFIWMLTKNQAPAGVIAVLVPAALAGFVFQVTASVLGVVISLRQELRRMQALGFVSAAIRLVLIGSACLVFIDARVAIVAGMIAGGLHAWLARRWVTAPVDCNASVSPEYRSEILSVVRRQAPLTIFYCIQGQLGIWLISVYGNSQRVAEIGALGRFAAVFSLIASMMSSIVVPRFARCQDRDTLRRRYWQVFGGIGLGLGLLVAGAALFPDPLLWLLGPQYANLRREVWLIVLSQALATMFSTLYSLTGSKAWIPPAIVSIPMEILTQVILILFFDISTVRGVLTIGCFSCVPPILLNIIIARRELAKAGVVPVKNSSTERT